MITGRELDALFGVSPLDEAPGRADARIERLSRAAEDLAVRLHEAGAANRDAALTHELARRHAAVLARLADARQQRAALEASLARLSSPAS